MTCKLDQDPGGICGQARRGEVMEGADLLSWREASPPIFVAALI